MISKETMVPMGALCEWLTDYLFPVGADDPAEKRESRKSDWESLIRENVIDKMFDLRPCPFCGSKDVAYEDYSADDEDECWMIQCNGCGIAVSCPGGEDGCCDPTKEEAARAWNRRARG